MIKWVREVLIKQYVKGLFDDLPFNWRKTIIGIVTLAISVALHFMGQDGSVGELLKTVFDVLAGLDARDTGALGALITAVGVIHKWLKADAGDKPS